MSSHLQTHKFTHILVRDPINCYICEKEFTMSSYLQKHKLTHTQVCRERHYKYDDCEKGFTWSSIKRRHKLTDVSETPLKCLILIKTAIKR